MFERISRSFELARSSWNVLRSDKKLVLFPIISTIGVILVLFTFLAPIAALLAGGQIRIDPQNDNVQVPVYVYALLFVFYFCTWSVILFCNAALISCALMRFNGQEATLGDGFRAASARLPQILAWALVSASVGVILKLIENAHEKVGEIISALLGTAWSIITFFVVPVLVVEKVGPIEAVKRSLALLRKAWGEALLGNIGLGFFKLLLALPGILLLVAGIVLAVTVQTALGIIVAALGLLWLLGFSAVASALDAIFLAALYQYAAFDRVPEGFDRDSIEHAFRSKKAA